MHSISNKQYEEYQQYLYDKDHSRIITPDFIRFLCQANNFDPEAIGKQILVLFGKYRAEGYYDLRK